MVLHSLMLMDPLEAPPQIFDMNPEEEKKEKREEEEEMRKEKKKRRERGWCEQVPSNFLGCVHR